MTEPAVAARVEAIIRQFDESLNRAGFRTRNSGDAPTDWQWWGNVGAEAEPVVITLNADFPYATPTVVLPNRIGKPDWHQTTAGALCLWGAHASGDLPWLDVNRLVQRIEEWITTSEAGWTDDEPQLDLEAYHPLRIIKRGHHTSFPLLVIEDWTSVAGHWFRAKQPRDTGLIEVLPGQRPAPPTPHKSRPRKPRRADQYLNGLAVDLGEMTAPLVTTDELIDAMGPNTARVGELLDAGKHVLIAARYTRSGSQGLIGFWLAQVENGLTRESFRVVERSPAQHRRAGWHAATIQDKKVSVVGAGSVGSYVADLLHRSGIRDLRVHDWDVLLPGNLVRHAGSPVFVGASKTMAVRETAKERDPTRPMETSQSISNLAAAVALLEDRDLVVDCTGDRLTWQMMLAAAEIVGVSFLHVAVEGHGQFGRVDVCPPIGGADPLPPNVLRPVALREREGGCGDPISPTPPTAVVETAAMGARFAIRMLAGEHVSPAGECRELFAVIP